MLTVNELDGFVPGDLVKIIEVNPPYEQELVGKQCKIGMIAAPNKNSHCIQLLHLDGRYCMWCNSNHIVKGEEPCV